MINYKQIKKLLATFCLISIIACTTRDDEFRVPEGSTPVAFILTNIVENNNARELITRQGFNVKLADASIGTDGAREWILPDAAVVTSKDISAKQITVQFQEGGTFEVMLRKNSSIGPLEATQEIIVLGLPSVDFDVQLVDPTSSGFSFDPTTRKITVEAGTEVQFTSTFEGGTPRDISWKFPGQTPDIAEGANPIITFKKLGTSQYNLRARNSTPFSDIRLPFYDLNKEELFYEVEVIPSSLPLLVNSEIIETEDGKIIITFSRDLDINTLDPKENFTLMINNVPTPISSVKIDPVNASNIIILADSNITNNNTATVSYNAVNLQSSDGFKAPSIPETEVSLFSPNLFSKEFDPTFENGDLKWTLDTDRTEKPEFNRVSPGNESDHALQVKLKRDTDNVAQFKLEEGLKDLKANTKIKIKFDYKMSPNFDKGELNVRVFRANKPTIRNFIGLGNFKKDDQWHTAEIGFVGGGNGTLIDEDGSADLQFQVILYSSSANEETEVSFDNFEFNLIEQD